MKMGKLHICVLFLNFKLNFPTKNLNLNTNNINVVNATCISKDEVDVPTMSFYFLFK